MWKKDKSVIVTAENLTGEQLHIKFKVLDTDLSDRWLNLLNQNKQLDNKLVSNYRRILSPEEREVNFQIFRNNILAINANYDRKLTDIVSLDNLYNNQDLLNDLHEEFEVYGDRLQELMDKNYFDNPRKPKSIFDSKTFSIWPKEKHDFELHRRFLTLNEQIHNFEAIFRNWDTPNEGLCTCLVDYIPAGIHEDLKPEDFFLFGSDLQWGWIYLGYNTLGKHWSSVLNENDIEVVRRDQVRPQARFAAEFYMHFGRSSITYWNRVKFYNWWMENNLSEIKNPRMKLEELALGYIPLARISDYKVGNNDSVFVPFEMSEIKTKEWNLNVWSKFNTIVNIKINEENN